MVKDIFRRIENPNKFRRIILESSKEIIQSLKGQQKILDIRTKKAELVKELKIILREINLLVDKLRDSFPAEIIAEHAEEEKKKTKKTVHVSKKKDKKTKKVKEEKKPEPSELTKLENKLADIESKLKSLS